MKKEHKSRISFEVKLKIKDGDIVTNKEIARLITEVVFDDTGRCECTPTQIAVKTFVEAINDPTKYSSGCGYHKEDMERSIFDFISDYRKNFIHYIDLFESK